MRVPGYHHNDLEANHGLDLMTYGMMSIFSWRVATNYRSDNSESTLFSWFTLLFPVRVNEIS